MQINARHLLEFRRIVQRFSRTTRLAKYGRWHHMSNDEIWKTVVYQIVVVGNSGPQGKMAESNKAQRELNYEHILSLPESKRIVHLNRVFRDFGVRYAARNPKRCTKSKAAVHNLMFLYANGGPTRFVDEISKLKDDYEKIKRVISAFSFIKSKGARDLLIELGLVKHAIAFDSRLQNIFKVLRIKAPEGFTSNETLYRSVEKTLLDKVCRPLKITGSRLDRILFQHTNEIVEMAQ